MLPPTTHILSSVLACNYRGRIQCIINMDLWISAKILLYDLLMKKWVQIHWILGSHPCQTTLVKDQQSTHLTENGYMYCQYHHWQMVQHICTDLVGREILDNIITIIIPFMLGYRNLVVMHPPLHSALSLIPSCSHKIPCLFSVSLLFAPLCKYVFRISEGSYHH